MIGERSSDPNRAGREGCGEGGTFLRDLWNGMELIGTISFSLNNKKEKSEI